MLMKRMAKVALRSKRMRIVPRMSILAFAEGASGPLLVDRIRISWGRRRRWR